MCFQCLSMPQPPKPILSFQYLLVSAIRTWDWIPPHGSSNFFCAASSSYSPACILAKLIFASLVRFISSLLMVEIRGLGLYGIVGASSREKCSNNLVTFRSAGGFIEIHITESPWHNGTWKECFQSCLYLREPHHETGFRRSSFFVADLTLETKS